MEMNSTSVSAPNAKQLPQMTISQQLAAVLMLLCHAGLQIYTACIDAEIDDKGFIVPGLGDAGDRAFGT